MFRLELISLIFFPYKKNYQKHIAQCKLTLIGKSISLKKKKRTSVRDNGFLNFKRTAQCKLA